ncbi:MAG: hypothetical protein QXE31_01070 [Candidatus Woesearchaeota archaeon]
MGLVVGGALFLTPFDHYLLNVSQRAIATISTRGSFSERVADYLGKGGLETQVTLNFRCEEGKVPNTNYLEQLLGEKSNIRVGPTEEIYEITFKRGERIVEQKEIESFNETITVNHVPIPSKKVVKYEVVSKQRRTFENRKSIMANYNPGNLCHEGFTTKGYRGR